MGRLTQSTEEIQSILDSVQDKADKADVVQPDWDATSGKAAVKNRPFGFNNPIRLSDADEITRELINADYNKYRITYKFSGYTFEYGLFMFARLWEYDPTWSFKNVSYKRIYSGDDFVVGGSDDSGDILHIEVVYDDYTDESYETIITLQGENLYEHTQAFFEENVILADSMEGLRSALPDIFIPDSIARQESVLDLYEEASLLWDETSSLWDETVSLNSEVSDIKGRVEELESGDGFDTKGIYPDLIAGDLAGRGESVPAEFAFRASGGKSIKDGRAYIKRIKGNSVVWNQKRNTLTPTNYFGYNCISQGNKVVLSNVSASTPDFGNMAFVDGFIPIVGHKYMLLSDSNLAISITSTNGFDVHVNAITQAAAREYSVIYLRTNSAPSLQVGESISFGVQIIDLTQMFGAGNEPTTIEEFNARKPIVADEFAYNEGEVIHMNAEGVKSIGDNAWNQYTAVRGVVNDQTGVFTPDSNALTMVDLVRCLPGEYYFNHIVHHNYRAGLHFYDENMNFIGVDGIWDSSTNNYSSGKKTIPAEAHYMRVGTPYDAVEQCMVTLVHSGWKQDTDAGYQPYWEDTLPLSIVRKYFPQGMKSAGGACDVIDCKKKQAITNVGVASNLSFSQMQEGVFYVNLPNMKLPTSTLERMKGILTNRYAVETDAPSVGNMADKSVIRFADGNIYIKDMSYTNADEFNAANTDLVVYYELAEPIVTEIDEPFGTDYRVADFGTEQAISSFPSAAFRADIIYQFNAVDMIREHELEITQLQQMIATMQAQLISLTNK